TINSASEETTPLLQSLGGQNVQSLVIHLNYVYSWDEKVLKTIRACLTDCPGLDEPMANAATDRSFESLRSIEIHDSPVNLVDFIGLVEEYLDKASRPSLEEIVLLKCHFELEGIHEDEDSDDEGGDDDDEEEDWGKGGDGEDEEEGRGWAMIPR
ncbi:hypothetical protein FRC01_000209, partial [Tulasnella sp. 417]